MKNSSPPAIASLNFALELAERYVPPEPVPGDTPAPPPGAAPAVADGVAPPPESIPARIEQPQRTARLAGDDPGRPDPIAAVDDVAAAEVPHTPALAGRPDGRVQQRGPTRLTARIPNADVLADRSAPNPGDPELTSSAKLRLLASASRPEPTNVTVDAHSSPPPLEEGASPLTAERTRLQSELARLDTLAQAHLDRVYRRQRRRGEAMSRAAALGQKARSCEVALERGVDTSGDKFVWTVVDAAHYRATEYRSRTEAGQQLQVALLALLDQPRPVDRQLDDTGAGTLVGVAPVGHLSSFRIEAELTSWPDGRTNVALRVGNLPLPPVTVERRDLIERDPAEIIAALENRIDTIAETAAGYRSEELAFRRLEARIDARLSQPFEHQPRLDALRTRLRDIEEILTPPDRDVTAAPPAMATIRRLPRRPRPDDPATVTEYDDCPMCLSSDLSSLGEDQTDPVLCKECGWVGSYPPHPRLVAVPSPTDTAPDPPVYRATPAIPAGPTKHPAVAAGVPTEPIDGAVVSAVDSTTATAAATPALEAVPAPALPSIHQQHQLHQQLYPAPQAGPIIQP